MAAHGFSRVLGLALTGMGLSFGCAQILGLKEDVPPTPCVLSSDCAPSELCIFRVCSAACKLDKDCTPGSRCLTTGGTAACVSASTRCDAGADGGVTACPDGTTCDATNTCRNSCDACHSDQSCMNGVCVGTDPNHDPGSVSSGAGGSGGASGGSSTGGKSGTAGSGAVTGGAGGKANTGGSSPIGDAGEGPIGEAGTPGVVVVTCQGTAVGESISCNETPDGTPINFPGGAPQSPCAAGKKACKADGTFGPCTGAVAPGPTDCTSSADKNCNGKADNAECGVCTAGATQYCYDGPNGTVNVGPCKQGTQVCELDTASSQTVWGPCAGEVTPASSDTCDATNDANCDNVPHEGCACVNGSQASCGEALNAQGNCAAGVSKCANGVWGACSIAPKAADTCDSKDDSTCNGVPNENCGCVNGATQACGVTGMGCTQGAITCVGGSYGACMGASCGDFSVGQTAKCSAVGPKTEDTDTPCTIAVCPGGYYPTGCDFTASQSAVCNFNGSHPGAPSSADVDTEKLPNVSAASCTLTSCTCRLIGF